MEIESFALGIIGTLQCSVSPTALRPGRGGWLRALYAWPEAMSVREPLSN